MTKFLFIFFIMNLAFVPLMSLYGLRVCPVLEPLGFIKGCSYTSAYIILVTSLNSISVLILKRRWSRKTFSNLELSVGSFLAYLISTIVALLILEAILHVNHITDLGRAPEILVLASLMLATTQSYGLSWAMFGKLKSGARESVRSFDLLWASHILKSLLPILITLIICVHFLFAQSVSGNDGRVSSVLDHDAFIDQTMLLIGILAGWLIVTFSFFFLNERDFSGRVKNHLEKMRADDYQFVTNVSQVWGLWRFILGTLNDFSKTMAEKETLEFTLEVLEESKRLLKQKNEQFIELSSAVQSLFLPPRNEYETPKWRIAGFYKPTDGCGGDWWSYSENKQKLSLILGDVTGHGPGSAMMTASIAAYMRAIENESPEFSIPETLKALNSYLLQLQRERKTDSYLMTMSALQVDFEKATLHSWSAGAPFGYLFRRDESYEVVGSRGTPLGVNPELTLGYDYHSIKPGDRLVMLTDGILDAAMQSKGSNEKRLIKLFRSTLSISPSETVKHLQLFMQSELAGEQEDDYTVTVLDFK